MTRRILGRMKILASAPFLTTSFAPMWLVSILGLGKDEGIDVELEVMGGPKRAVEGIVSGHGDVTFVNLVFMMLARDRGVPLRPFYAYVRGQNRRFSVPADSEIGSLVECRGRTIGLHFDDPELFEYARAAIRGVGLDPDRDVKFKTLPGSPLDVERMVAAVRAGEVDVIWQLDILTGLFEAEGMNLRELVVQDLEGLTPSSCLCALDENLSSRPEAFGALGRAVARATLYAMRDPGAAVRAVWKAYPETAPNPGNDAERAYRRELAALTVRLHNQRIEGRTVEQWGAITREEIEAWQNYLLKTGAIRTRQDPDTYFSNDLVPAFNAFDASSVTARCANDW